jgi:hypothetical protein
MLRCQLQHQQSLMMVLRMVLGMLPAQIAAASTSEVGAYGPCHCLHCWWLTGEAGARQQVRH